MDEILIYGVVGDPWDGLDAATLVPLITEGDGDLTIAINSPGGYVMEGLAIFNAIVRAVESGRKVTCRIDGLAASMASVIAMAGSEVVMAETALLMIHNPWDCACGDAAELRAAADQLDKLKGTIVGIYARRTGMDADALSTMMDAETWLSAEDALAQGFIDTIGTMASANAALRPSNIKPFGFRKAPDHPLIAAKAQARTNRPAPAATTKKEDPQMSKDTPAAGETAAPAITAADVTAAAAAASAQASENTLKAERIRIAAIRNLCAQHKVGASVQNKLIDDGVSIEDARAQVLDTLAARTEADGVGAPGGVAVVTQDARDKWQQGAMNWLLVRSGMAQTVKAAATARGESIDLDPGEFRGVTLLDLAREANQLAGVRNVSRDPAQIVGSAFTARNDATQGAGDFPVLLENTMYKVLQSAYQITPDTWSRFCGKGTVSDFRPSNRYLRGTFGALDSLNDLSEFKRKGIPDGEKQTIQAATKGNIITLSRQAIINDDLGVFVMLASDLGRAAKLSVEKDVIALLVANPNTYDGNALFSAAHRNIAGGGFTLPSGAAAPAAAAIGVASFDAARVAMASQLDPSGNEILDIRPQVLLVPLVDEGTARVIIGSPYDPDASSKLQRPNMVQGLVGDIVGSARLSTGTSGHGWYFFADKDMAPAIEVAFLNGVEEPFLDNSLGWKVDGTEFKVRFDYGVGAVNWRSAFYNPGL